MQGQRAHSSAPANGGANDDAGRFGGALSSARSAANHSVGAGPHALARLLRNRSEGKSHRNERIELWLSYFCLQDVLSAFRVRSRSSRAGCRCSRRNKSKLAAQTVGRECGRSTGSDTASITDRRASWHRAPATPARHLAGEPWAGSRAEAGANKTRPGGRMTRLRERARHDCAMKGYSS
jgi:hypothetical protein